MATKRVVAYFMHEPEEAEILAVMPQGERTSSFVVGELDDDQIAVLRAKGLIVRDTGLTRPPPAAPKAVAQVTMMAPSQQVVEAATPEAPLPNDYYTLVLRGPLLEERRKALTDTGMLILSKRPLGYKVFMSTADVPAVQAMPFVESLTWDDQPTPVSVVETAGVAPSEDTKLFDVKANTADQATVLRSWMTAQNIEQIGFSGRKIRIRLAAGDPKLAALAGRPEVSSVTEYVEPVIFNDHARVLVGGVGTVAGAPAEIGLDGTGQIIAIADTGIDLTHPAFAGRVVAKFGRGRGPLDVDDPNGHGTHVAGTAAGDGSSAGGGTAGKSFRGISPKASIVIQSLIDATGTKLTGLPLDLGELFQQAYDADARIHSNSWGSRMPSVYSMNSEEVDEFVWDHPDMLVVIAAGNDGVSPPNPAHAAPGFVDWLSIGSPATAKNALTVGASRSDRTDGPFAGQTYGGVFGGDFAALPIMGETISGDPECLAGFSSRGPCDNRTLIKPDLVAPGTEIASTSSSTAPAGAYEGPVPGVPGYAFDSGTSMATPLVAGCAALVRQYYVANGNANPSAALLKATLINGTKVLTGTDSTAPPAGFPNYHQGHGLVWMPLTIPCSLSPAGWTLRFADNVADKLILTGDRRRFQFTTPDVSEELRFCLAYTDPPGRGIQNNLDLIVHHIQSGKKYVANDQLPNVLVLPDPDNNVETIRITNAPAGTYFIQVQAGNLLKSGQPFALVVTGQNLPPLTPLPG